MAILVLGVLLWSAVHLLPIYAPGARDRFAKRLGEKRWKGVFSLLSVAAIVVIVVGWRRTDPAGVLYWPPEWALHLNNLLMLVAVGLLGAGHAKAFPRRYVRNPMLTAVALWAVAHLLANGEWRSVVLFGGLGLWAAAAIVGTNRRDGPWTPPPPSPTRTNVIWAAVSLVVFALLVVVHPWLFGAWPLPG